MEKNGERKEFVIGKGGKGRRLNEGDYEHMKEQ